MNSIIYVGMDVHLKSFTLCCFTIEEEKILYTQKMDADYKHVLKYLERIRSIRKDEEVEFICGYEAGCLGYTLYHQLNSHNVKCVILAPSTMSVSPGGQEEKERYPGCCGDCKMPCLPQLQPGPCSYRP